MDRRSFLISSAASVVAARFAHVTSATDSVVKTRSGALRGKTLADGVRVFRGVPFAEPPTGPLRFRPPVPVKPWTGTRDATTFAAEAIQPDHAADRKGNIIPQSEDCLYLNIWSPAEPGPHPVFVWIHGGGFTGGRSFDPMSDGAGFARAGIVVVSLAYRLGVFGFLDVSSALGAAYAGSANNGLRDLICALTWLQQNLSAFGGDPGRVTVGGESAGAKLTDILMGVPAAKGLFQQMISESGGAERVFPAAKSVSVGKDFLRTSKLSAPLQSVTAAELLEMQELFVRDTPIHFPLRPALDTSLLPVFPLAAMRSGSSRGKRLLLGTNLDESALFIGPAPTREIDGHDLGNLATDQFHAIERKYAELYPDMSPERRRIRALTAEEYWVPSLRVADLHIAGGGTAFVYRLDHSEPTGRFAGLAPHTAELRYVWERVPGSALPGEHSFATKLHTAWAGFIRGGTPAAPGLPEWPLYDASTRPTMILDDNSRVERNPSGKELALWNGVLSG